MLMALFFLSLVTLVPSATATAPSVRIHPAKENYRDDPKPIVLKKFHFPRR
jgi:hypothetical protein